MSQPVYTQGNQHLQRYRIHAEDRSAESLVPFVTARRFWLLVYMLAGSTGVAMLIARFLIRPILVKVQHARQAYQIHIHEQLKSFVANLARSITALPGRQIIVDTARHRLYVNTETQTDDNDLKEDLSQVDEASPEIVGLSSIASKLKDFGQDQEERSYLDLSIKITSLKTYLYGFDSYTYTSSYGGYGPGASSGGRAGGEAMQKIKAEIRGVKGSLLNARSLASAR